MKDIMEARSDDSAKKSALVEHDKDWVYTGVTHQCMQCMQCGHSFDSGLPETDYCPECGEAICQGED